MKIHRFFVDSISLREGTLSITDAEVIHQMKNVLRLQMGDTIAVLNNQGKEYIASIVELKNSEGVFLIKNIFIHEKNSQTINLYFSIPKKDKAEWVLQKCTELGVEHFYPIISERTEKLQLNKERAEKIIKEASEQSEKKILPVFHEPIDLIDAMRQIDSPTTIYLDMHGEKINLEKLKKEITVSVFVGPEGGWSDDDKKIFDEHGVGAVSLGDFVLRAETASVAVVSALKIN